MTNGSQANASSTSNSMRCFTSSCCSSLCTLTCFQTIVFCHQASELACISSSDEVSRRSENVSATAAATCRSKVDQVQFEWAGCDCACASAPLATAAAASACPEAKQRLLPSTGTLPAFQVLQPSLPEMTAVDRPAIHACLGLQNQALKQERLCLLQHLSARQAGWKQVLTELTTSSQLLFFGSARLGLSQAEGERITGVAHVPKCQSVLVTSKIARREKTDPRARFFEFLSCP